MLNVPFYHRTNSISIACYIYKIYRSYSSVRRKGIACHAACIGCITGELSITSLLKGLCLSRRCPACAQWPNEWLSDKRTDRPLYYWAVSPQKHISILHIHTYMDRYIYICLHIYIQTVCR